MRKDKGIIHLLPLLLVAVIAVGVWWILQNKTLNNSNNTKANKIKIDNDISIDSDWKTYRNEKFGFRTKYHNESPPTVTDQNADNVIRFGTNPLKSSYGYTITINTEMGTDSLRTELIGHVTDKIDSEEEVFINDITWTKLNYQIFLTTHLVPMTTATTNHNDYTYNITSSTADIDQILSTFRFDSRL